MMSININSFMLILCKIAEIDTFNGSWNSGGIKLSQSNIIRTSLDDDFTAIEEAKMHYPKFISNYLFSIKILTITHKIFTYTRYNLIYEANYVFFR